MYLNGVEGALTATKAIGGTSIPNFGYDAAIGRAYSSGSLKYSRMYVDDFIFNIGTSLPTFLPAGEYSAPYSITITPAKTDKLSCTVATGSSVKSDFKGDIIRLRTAMAEYDIYAESIYPASANWVDQLD